MTKTSINSADGEDNEEQVIRRQSKVWSNL